MPHLNDLNPLSVVSAIILPSTGSTSDVNDAVPYKVYSTSSSDFYSTEFLSGAADQVAYTYKKLGGDILDIELMAGNVYANYEEAVIEYSYIINMHQSKNVMSRVMGSTTGTFDHNGILQSGSFKNSLSGSHASLKFPKFSFDYSNDIMKGVAAQVGIGSNLVEYSASFKTVIDQQDYNIYETVHNLALSGTFGPYFNLGNKKIKITKVYYMPALASWRFFGNYGGGYGGNYTYGYGGFYGASSYGDSYDEQLVIPVWENIAQAQAYKLMTQVRCMNYSYEIIGSNIRLYPKTQLYSPNAFWFKFTIENNDVWNESYEKDGTKLDSGIDGINNVNSLPFEVIPYNNINSLGKNWIRNYCYFLSLETLGHVRSKFDSIPIPNGNVTLDGKDLLTEAKDGKEKLRKELLDDLEKLEYNNLVKRDAEMLDANLSISQKMPSLIYIG